MLRDMKIFKRNTTGKKANLEEIENVVPINPTTTTTTTTTDSSVGTSSAVDAPRAPLVTIQEPSQNPRFGPEQEAGFRSKVDRTTPSKGKGATNSSSFRTPEKQGGVGGFSTRKKFGWGLKNEQLTSTTNGAGAGADNHNTHDEKRTDLTLSHGLSQLPPSSRGPSTIGNGGGLPSVTPRSVRTMGKPTPNPSECSSTQSTPTKSVIKPTNNTGFVHLNGSRPPMNIGGVRLGNSTALSKGIPMSCASSSSVVNTVDVPHFELREDPSFWMDHNVQVLIRIRPLNSMERSSQGYNRCLKQESAQSIAWIGQPETRFTFDHVACESVNQEMLFRVAGLPMVENCLSGYNSCMFAYGQTGSGKTHTMLGEIAELEVRPSPDRGMTPRIFEFLFARIRAEEESRRDEKLQYNCKCSFLEIYNEQITDLLDPSSTNLLLREDMKKGGVYVENLTEFEVQTVNDILSLLIQGAANRKVAATNMNRESSRSHSVFTCVIESRWEKDSTTNLRFARLNLVDLAGSERQKTSGAEGERLKEAANINKSLSTLGHVIMVLVDLAHGKQRHIPYRDSRLTFLLQDSLGGNSKTMIIANVSPSICSAAETLSTLKFAQRAKLIQNNAVVNEDASGDVIALQHQIWLLKEELAVLKRQNVSRSLSFRSAIFGNTIEKGSDVEHVEEMADMVLESSDDCHESASLGIVRLSTKQMQSLETTLTGAMRREQMADTSMKQLEAEIEQLNRLVRQREEDTQCIKMMLKFREDKVKRMESLVGGHIPSDAYLMEENSALSEELQLVRTRVDRNPEVTRFALENIRLLEKLRKFQDFYEEGERELLLAEVSELRDQLLQFLDDNTKKYTSQNLNMLQKEAVHNGGEHDSCHLELNRTYKELEECRNSLNSCLENNAKLTRDIEDLQSQLKSFNSSHDEQYVNFKSCKESLMEVQTSEDHLHDVVCKGEANWKDETVLKYTDEIMNLQLELDILKTLLQEERLSRSEIEERALYLSNDLELEKDRYSEVSKQCEDTKNELKEARSVIEALESQQILFINELEDLKGSDKFMELLSKKEHEISMLQEQLYSQELRNPPCYTLSESGEFPLQAKLQRMHDSLEMAKRLNTQFKSDRALQTSNEQEMDEVRRQVEAETAEVIVCMQEELNILQQQVNECNAKESETKQSFIMLETEKKDLEEKFCQMTQDKERLSELLQEKDGELKTLSEEWERLAIEIEEVIVDGHDALKDASDEVDFISRSFPQRTWISEKIGNMIKIISEKDSLIDELRRCLEEAQDLKCDMEWKLRSLRGAALAITEAQLQESGEKEKELLMLTSDLVTKTSIISELENRIRMREDQIRKAEICAMVGFVIVNRFSEINSGHLDALRNKDILITEAMEAEEQNHTLRSELECSKECCVNLEIRLSEEQERIHAMECKLAKVENDDILKARETLDEFKLGVTTFNSCINEYGEQLEGSQMIKAPGWNAHPCAYGDSKERTEIETCEAISEKNSHIVDRTHRDVCDRDATIVLLRKEIESALESLKEIQTQTLKLLEEKEALKKSELQSRQSIECIIPQLLTLQAETNDVEKQSDLKMAELVHKLRTIEELVQEARSDHFQNKELLERELCEAKVVAAQKTMEASSLLANFEEAQETMKEADSMVNALMTANETAKLEIARLKKMEATLTKERDSLINEVQSLQFSNAQKDQQHDNLEMQHCSDLSEIGGVVLAVEDTIAQFQTAFKEEFNSMLCDFHGLKSQLLHSANLTRSWLEEIWSEVVVKDCAVSVLHLCHMGVLLEAVTGLNAENGLLHHGLSESNSIIVDLKEHNFKAKREVEMCRILKGKLLVDIKSSFDRVSRKEDETGKFNAKLSAFEKKILDLQLQEELMLARSDSMGSELAVLMKELERSNTNALTTFFDQEKQLREKEELVMLDLTAKDFESLILASELKHMAIQKFTSETVQEASNEILENMKKEVILLKVEAEMEKQVLIDMEVEADLLRRVVEEANADRNDLSQKLTQCHFSLMKMDQENKSLEQDVQSLNEVACTNDKLKGELGVSLETNGRLSSQVEVLQTETERLAKELGMREAALEGFVCKLQAEIETRDAAINRMSFIDAENGTLKCEIMKLKEDYCRALADLQEKKSEFESSCSRMDVYDEENHRLQNRICSLETCIANLHTDLDMRNGELDELRHCQSIVAEELNSKCQSFEIQSDVINSLKEDNDCLKSKLMSVEQNKDELLALLTLNVKKCSNSFQAVNMMENRMIQALDEKNNIILLDKMLNKICENEERVGSFVAECECLENSAKELLSENLSLQAELSRKDEVLKGLSFDLSLLQESASNTKDQKYEFEEMKAAMELLEADCSVKSAELDEAVAHVQVLETQLQEKIDLISTIELDTKDQKYEFEEMKAAMELLEADRSVKSAELDEAVAHVQVLETQLHEKIDLISTIELDLSKERQSLKLVLDENVDLKAQMDDILEAKRSIEEELIERREVTESLEEELFQMDNAVGQMDTFLQGLKNDYNKVVVERDHLDSEVLVLKEKLEMAETLAEEKDAIAVEAQQIAESQKTYAEEKEEEVKLLERSVEELESTVDALENKVDLIKGEAERQRLQREELEMELQSIRHQMLTVYTSDDKMEVHNISSGDVDLQRLLEEKECDLQEAKTQIQYLEKNMNEKEAEISQCRAHISELNLHAEAQARDYKQKFKALEAMAEHVRPESVLSHAANSPSKKSEKNAAKSRGSGSPFKCIGLGLAHQLKSEKDEELSARRLQIEELEALAANRQKEIFMLNARLAAAESMTHDVIRDLLGVKSDMTNYASLLDHQQVQKITEKAGFHSEETLVKEQEVVKLKQQLHEFIEERQGWLEEINRRHAEVVSARIACEKLRQRDQFLTTENEMLKTENVKHKKKVMELEDEVKKLSGQQNLQQRIHHHAKIKEENNVLKVQNESLSGKLRRSETMLSRVKEELARFRASNGRTPFIDFDEEHRLHNKLKETEEERLQLAQKLVSLCTSILKAAGITRPTSEISLPVAEDALDQLKDRVSSQERELQDMKFKSKIANEKIRLSELKQQSSPLGSGTEENCTTTPRRLSQTPFLTTLSRG